MSAEETIKKLLGDADADDQAKRERIAARLDWVRQAAAAWRQAHRDIDEVLDEAEGRMSADEFERLCEAQLDKVDAMMDEIRAAIDEDKWPRELYWGGI